MGADPEDAPGATLEPAAEPTPDPPPTPEPVADAADALGLIDLAPITAAATTAETEALADNLVAIQAELMAYMAGQTDAAIDRAAVRLGAILRSNEKDPDRKPLVAGVGNRDVAAALGAERVAAILTEVANIIGASILNIAHQDYDPQGASVTMLISEEPTTSEALVSAAGQDEMPGPLRAPHRPPLHEAVVAHLDKSHITVHTYPESHPDNGISTFRADIDVSTCGRISPLRALNYLIHSFDSDIVIMDYRIRGFTRDIKGVKHFVDHDLTSIQNFLSDDTRERYDRVDVKRDLTAS